MKLRVSDIQPLTDRISEFGFVDAHNAQLPNWTPGAHVTFDTSSGSRSYSLIKWPGETSTDYRFAIQREGTGEGGSKAMHALNLGAKIAVTAPANDFELADQNCPVTLLAGGIGITPIISMATELQETGCDFKLHYTGRSAAQMSYLRELRECFGANFIVYFDDEKPLDLPALMANIRDHALYICGPQGMIEAARSAAETAGIAPSHIHVELFTTAAPAVGDTAFEVEIASSGKIIQVAADQTIIEALEAADIDVMYDCERGTCGICQTDVISGTPDHRDIVLSQSERDSGKVMQICVSRARSPRLVLDL